MSPRVRGQLYSDSEDNLGRGIAASPLGANAVVYTKVGKYIRWRRGAKISGPISPWAPYTVPLEERVVVPDFSKNGAAQSLKESLERMGIERCHTLRLHDPDSIDGGIEHATDPKTGIVAGLRELRAAGVIEHVSFGMNANADHRIVTAVSARSTALRDCVEQYLCQMSKLTDECLDGPVGCSWRRDDPLVAGDNHQPYSCSAAGHVRHVLACLRLELDRARCLACDGGVCQSWHQGNLRLLQ